MVSSALLCLRLVKYIAVGITIITAATILWGAWSVRLKKWADEREVMFKDSKTKEKVAVMKSPPPMSIRMAPIDIKTTSINQRTIHYGLEWDISQFSAILATIGFIADLFPKLPLPKLEKLANHTETQRAVS